MAYDLPGVFEKVKANLDRGPRTSLYEICDTLGIERHTIERAIRLATGKTFGSLQRQVVLDKAFTLLEHQPALSIKEIASQLGYTARAFSGLVKRTCSVSPKDLRSRVPGASMKPTRP